MDHYTAMYIFILGLHTPTNVRYANNSNVYSNSVVCHVSVFMIFSFFCGVLPLGEQQIMRNLVRRYVTVQQRKAESQGVTEDDVNEIKQDISAFRCEIVEILKESGMKTSNVSGQGAGKNGSCRKRCFLNVANKFIHFPRRN